MTVTLKYGILPRMSEKLIGVCVIGSGRAGMIHARNFARVVPGARLAALVDPQAEALAAAGRELGVDRLFSDYRQALADKDVHAVVVVTPTTSPSNSAAPAKLIS